MPNFVVMVGLPYSGKSYVANSLGLFKTYAKISSDDLVHMKAKELGLSYNQCFNDVVGWAQDKAERDMLYLLSIGKDIILDQTNLTRSSRKRKLELIPQGYKSFCIVVPSPASEIVEKRMKERSSHSVPMSVMDTMLKLYEEPSLDEGFDVLYRAGFDDIVFTRD